MREIGTETELLGHGVTLVFARIPARRCGAHNEAAAKRVVQLIKQVNPDAFDPVPEAVAEAVVRDIPLELRPPNCDGCHEAVRTPRASFPPYVDDREDDEGEAITGYPPGVACNVTGECGE